MHKDFEGHGVASYEQLDTAARVPPMPNRAVCQECATLSQTPITDFTRKWHPGNFDWAMYIMAIPGEAFPNLELAGTVPPEPPAPPLVSPAGQGGALAALPGLLVLGCAAHQVPALVLR